jgi:hypothetical protein
MNTKITVGLVAVGVLAIILVGVVSAQIATTPSPTGTPNGAQYDGFWGWMGRCLGFRGANYHGTQAPAYVGQLANITVTDPNAGQTSTYQGYYGYGNARCMREYFP